MVFQVVRSNKDKLHYCVTCSSFCLDAKLGALCDKKKTTARETIK